MWGFVGPPPEETPEDDAVYLWTHKLLKIGYNENRVRQLQVWRLGAHGDNFACTAVLL